MNLPLFDMGFFCYCFFSILSLWAYDYEVSSVYFVMYFFLSHVYLYSTFYSNVFLLSIRLCIALYLHLIVVW